MILIQNSLSGLAGPTFAEVSKVGEVPALATGIGLLALSGVAFATGHTKVGTAGAVLGAIGVGLGIVYKVTNAASAPEYKMVDGQASIVPVGDK